MSAALANPVTPPAECFRQATKRFCNTRLSDQRQRTVSQGASWSPCSIPHSGYVDSGPRARAAWQSPPAFRPWRRFTFEGCEVSAYSGASPLGEEPRGSDCRLVASTAHLVTGAFGVPRGVSCARALDRCGAGGPRRSRNHHPRPLPASLSAPDGLPPRSGSHRCRPQCNAGSGGGSNCRCSHSFLPPPCTPYGSRAPVLSGRASAATEPAAMAPPRTCKLRRREGVCGSCLVMRSNLVLSTRVAPFTRHGTVMRLPGGRAELGEGA